MCSFCKVRPARNGQRWCAVCHAKYMRRWREANDVTKMNPREELAHAMQRCAKSGVPVRDVIWQLETSYRGQFSQEWSFVSPTPVAAMRRKAKRDGV